MDLHELDRAAYEMEELPDGLEMPEIYYFETVRALYAMYSIGKISKEQAEKEKRKVKLTYRNFEVGNRVGKHDMAVLRKIQANKDYYDKNGCKVCKDLASQICGLKIEFGEVEA